MKGYKAFREDMTCRDMQYEVGKTYKHSGKIELCSSGFHFCRDPVDCFNFYDKYSRLCEVEASGEIIHGDDGKSVCSEITILRELTGRERWRITYGNGDGNGYGYGDGNGYGYGYGYGDGYGDGYGNGYGYGDGYGDGDGYGYGNGDGYGYGIQRILLWRD